MQEQFLQRMQQIPNYRNKRYLLAVSGGADSVVLCALFHQNQLDFEMAHCNFKLRMEESDRDQLFVENLAKQLNVNLHLKVCDARSYIDKNIQIAARELRYQYFNELKQAENFDFIVTGHHLDDAIETFFINLNRGTGLKGLLGIPENKDIIRPLLRNSREEILNFAAEHLLTWVEDSSNLSDKYLRNHLRHHIIPEFKKFNLDFSRSMQKTFEFLQESQSILEEWFERKRKAIVLQKNEDLHINLKELSQIKQQQLFLHQLLSSYGFTDWKAVLKLTDAQTGKMVSSHTHQLVRHQNKLILTKHLQKDERIYSIEENQSGTDIPISLRFKAITQINKIEIKNAKPNEIYVDFDLLKFPLHIRKWKSGDYFYPFGMKGKKKLSDYFKDEKISLIDKEKIWLLCSGDKIIWIVGKRADNRFRINQQTNKIYKIKQL